MSYNKSLFFFQNTQIRNVGLGTWKTPQYYRRHSNANGGSVVWEDVVTELSSLGLEGNSSCAFGNFSSANSNSPAARL